MNHEDGQTNRPFLHLEKVVPRLNGGPGETGACPPVTLSIARGEFLSLVGLRSACGLPLLRTVAGLEPPQSGRVELDGDVPKPGRIGIGIVFRRPMLLEWRSVLGNVLLASDLRKPGGPADAERAARLLAVVGLTDVRGSRPDGLSRAEAQKVSICRALLTRPDLLLMDDPFDGLGALEREQSARDLQRLLAGSATTVLLITSGIDEAVVLSDGVAMASRDGIAQTMRIDAPHPRLPGAETAARVAEYAGRLRILLEAHGHLS
jgi:NitT/TauT family transport system ATP-binding protein